MYFCVFCILYIYNKQSNIFEDVGMECLKTCYRLIGLYERGCIVVTLLVTLRLRIVLLVVLWVVSRVLNSWQQWVRYLAA